MTFTVNSYATHDSKGALEPYKLERRSTLPDDVVIKILYAGVCHSDIHFRDNLFGNTHYPLVPGHEIVGEVESVGDKVTKYKAGDIVGVGCMVDSCGECEWCEKDIEVHCPKIVFTYGQPDPRFEGNFTAGGYSEKIVVAEHFVVNIPKALQTKELLPEVAPILCAGITTYAPLRRYKVGKGSKVAVCGLGGLGQMAVKLAKSMGAEVTVVSRSHNKDKDAEKLGASLISVSSEQEMKQATETFDLVLDTIPKDHDINPFMNLTKKFGEFCMVGYFGPLSAKVNTATFVFGHKGFNGSIIGGVSQTQEVLDYCAEHKITPTSELIPMEKINDAWDELEKGNAAFRYVIDIEKFRQQHSSRI